MFFRSVPEKPADTHTRDVFIRQHCFDLARLYSHAVEFGDQKLGSTHFPRECTKPVLEVQQLYPTAKIADRKKQLAGSAVAFFFGGQLRSDDVLSAREYLEWLATVLTKLTKNTQVMLDKMARLALHENGVNLMQQHECMTPHHRRR